MSKKETQTFEEALSRLETIVAALEKGEEPLDKSLELFEEGVQLSNFCTSRLAEVEAKIEILVEKGKELKAESFEPDN